MKMKRVDGAVGIGNWNLNAIEKFKADLEQIAKDATNEALEIAIQQDGCDACFMIIYDEAVRQGKDPLTLSIELPFGETEDDGPRFEINLRDVIKDNVEYCIDGPQALLLRDALRSAADEIDRMIGAKT